MLHGYVGVPLDFSLSETDSKFAPENRGGNPKRKAIFQPSIFKAASFREGMSLSQNVLLENTASVFSWFFVAAFFFVSRQKRIPDIPEFNKGPDP